MMKITKRQLRRIIAEEKQKLLSEAPAGQYDRRIYDMFKEAIKEVVYDVAIEQGLTDEGGMHIDAEAIQAASAALADAALSPAKRRKIMAGRDIREIVPTVAVTRKATE